MCSNQHPSFFPIARIHWSLNQTIEMGVISLIIIPLYPLTKFMLPILMILRSSGPDGVSSKGMLPQVDKKLFP